MCRVCDEEGYASEDTFYVTAEERVSLKMYNKNVPYVTTGVCSVCTLPLRLCLCRLAPRCKDELLLE